MRRDKAFFVESAAALVSYIPLAIVSGTVEASCAPIGAFEASTAVLQLIPLVTVARGELWLPPAPRGAAARRFSRSGDARTRARPSWILAYEEHRNASVRRQTVA